MKKSSWQDRINAFHPCKYVLYQYAVRTHVAKSDGQIFVFIRAAELVRRRRVVHWPSRMACALKELMEKSWKTIN